VRLAGLLLVPLVATPAVLAGTETGYGVAIAAGTDANPTLAAEGGGAGAFAALSLDGAVYRTLGEKTELFADGAARTRLHASDADAADRDEARVGVGLAVAPTDRSSVAVGATYQMFRGTWVDRASGDPYTYLPAVGAEPVSLAERLDHDAAELYVDGQQRAGKRTTLGARATLRDADYVRDYADLEQVGSLDHRMLSFEPRAALRLTQHAALWMSLALADVDYTGLPATDGSGALLPDTSRSYRSAKLRASLRLEAGRAIWGFGAASGLQDDPVSGYWDSQSSTVHASLSRDFEDGSRLRLFGAVDDVRYDRALVPVTAGGAVRRDELHRLQARYDRSIGRALRWFAEGGSEEGESRDPAYRYDRAWAMAGVEFRR
jgi:hypothetical protein